jgi:hypothetical protein
MLEFGLNKKKSLWPGMEPETTELSCLIISTEPLMV